MRIPITEYTQNLFYKKYNILNSQELFRIIDINKERIPYLYKLADLANEKISGSFYEAELVPSVLKKTYPIQIIKKLNTKPKKYFVRWVGYPDSFNSYINESDLKIYNKGRI